MLPNGAQPILRTHYGWTRELYKTFPLSWRGNWRRNADQQTCINTEVIVRTWSVSHPFPSPPDISKDNPSKAVLVSRVLCDHMKVFRSQRAKHIPHPHPQSAEMAKKSDVIVLHKNETKRADMINIMMASQEFLGKEYTQRVASGGTVERDADTPEEGLDHLEPVAGRTSWTFWWI